MSKYSDWLEKNSRQLTARLFNKIHGRVKELEAMVGHMPDTLGHEESDCDYCGLNIRVITIPNWDKRVGQAEIGLYRAILEDLQRLEESRVKR